jgi:hypothetical protein
MDVDATPTAPSVPKPLDIEALHNQFHQSPSLDVPNPTPEASQGILPPIQTSDPPSAVTAQPVPDAAVLTPDAAVLTVEQAKILTAAPTELTAPSEQTSFPRFTFGMPYSQKPTNQLSRKRRNDSWFKATRRDTHTDANVEVTVTEKARLVEQQDLITRKIIEEKDEKITELEAQV